MKTLKKILLLLCLFAGSTGLSQAQNPVNDSINIQIDEKMEVNITVFDFKDLSQKVKNDLTSLRSIVKDYKNFNEYTSYFLNFKPGKSLAIKQMVPDERIIWENGKQITYHFDNKCKITADSYVLQIRFNSLNEMLSDSSIHKITNVIDSTEMYRGRFVATYNYSYNGEKLIHSPETDKIRGQLDALLLMGGIGASLIKNQLVTDITARAGIVFSKKGIWKNQYYLSFNQYYTFYSNQKLQFNNFINLGYSYNLSNDVKKSNWMGFELGYLVTRHGDLFEKNTFRLGVNWELGKYISVMPQLFVAGDFSNMYPGLRIGFGF